jgi:hypothetical protein
MKKQFWLNVLGNAGILAASFAVLSVFIQIALFGKSIIIEPNLVILAFETAFFIFIALYATFRYIGFLKSEIHNLKICKSCEMALGCNSKYTTYCGKYRLESVK